METLKKIIHVPELLVAVVLVALALFFQSQNPLFCKHLLLRLQ